MERKIAPILPLSKRLNWPFLLFFAATHLLGAAGIYYLLYIKFSWATIDLAVMLYFLRGFSITGGYHRYFTHKSFACARPLETFFILFGASAWQHSILVWCSDHERHHNLTDTDKDPYNAKRGFWWSHIGWLLFKGPPLNFTNIPDIVADPLIRFQHRFYFPLAIGFGFALPTALALLWSDPIGAFLGAGFTGLTMIYHASFSVNSVSHYFGKQPYTLSSARSGWITALPTLGEGGDHNFHHAFSWDYRAGGHEWYRIDPTKWMLCFLSYFGLVWNLRRASPERILRAKEELFAQRENKTLVTV